MADNISNTEEQIKQSAQWKKELGGVYDVTIDIHTTLLDQIQALKNVREESKNVYALQDELNKLIQKGVELNNKKASLEADLAQNAQNELDIIKKGFEARRDQGELIGKLVREVQTINDLTELQTSGAQLTVEQQNKLNAALQKKASLDSQILATQMEEERLSKLLEAGAIDQLNHLSKAEKEQLKKYLNVVKENEEYKIYLKNNDINLKAQMDIIEAQKAQLTTWQKINQYIDFQTEKWKKVKVISETIDWGKKQLDSIGISFSAILTNVLAYGKTLTDAAKGLGISVDSVRELSKGYEETAMQATSLNSSANAAFLTTKNQLQAQQELNKSLGTSGLVTAQARVDQVTLTKQMGLQADEAANLYKLGLLNGTSAKKVAETTAQQVINLRKQKDINLDLKQVLIDVGKVSGQLAAQYKNNPELLAKAVVQAKELGLTLEQTAKMGDKLLDFPGSIESELKAELLTGKALNLEQARYLQLMGDSAGAAKELMNNVGGLEEFQKLNVIQQRALAEAVGLTADELADSLTQQKLLEGSAWATQNAFEEAVKNADTEEEKARIRAQISQSNNAQQLLEQYEQISAQEKFNQAIEKLKEMVASFVDGPFGKFLEGLSDAVTAASTLKGLMWAIGAILVGNMARGIAGFITQLSIARGIAAQTAAASFATASAVTLGFGIAAILAGLYGAYSVLSSATGETINTGGTGGGSTSGAGGVNAGGGGINIPQERERPIILEANIKSEMIVNNKVASEMNTRSTMVANNKIDNR